MNPVQPQGCIKLESKNLSMPTSQDNNCLCIIYIYTHVRMYVCCIYVCVHMLFNTRIPSAMPKKKYKWKNTVFAIRAFH
jgi:hypothetical protein